ncbi:MAG: prenyltransferase [Nitrosopumilus sp.]|nr:prenyltransferase [Nitrosopumilus sp.]
MITVWLRVIRIRFLLASVIAVSVGLAINWNLNGSIDFFSAVLTFAGVMALHASVDLLNDFWDYKRGIDTSTKRTKMSGGTGVLPEGLLKPSSVYRAGIAFLIIGGAIGLFFVFTDGWMIAVILAFAIFSIYFYSTKIVDSGLAEFFVAVKGTMIVLGTYFIQSNQITTEAALGGIIVGVLSSLVLFIASFPDFEADKSKGRKTLVIAVGKQNATLVFWVFPIVSVGCLIFGIVLQLFPTSVLIALVPIPLIILAGMGLRKNYKNSDLLFPSMSKTLMYSRLTGILFVIGILIGIYP